MEVDSKNPLFFERVFLWLARAEIDIPFKKSWRGSRLRMTIDEQIDIRIWRGVSIFFAGGVKEEAGKSESGRSGVYGLNMVQILLHRTFI